MRFEHGGAREADRESRPLSHATRSSGHHSLPGTSPSGRLLFSLAAISDKTDREYLYQGISTRSFKRQFSLADYVQVKSVTFDNGLLRIELACEVPEAMKRRRIAINAPASKTPRQIESVAA
ncbi:hypothetical protein CK489_28535 [Bradyrhizobium sp. UFLA03-84]|nr:hypothetical protein CK489_28535 [Bradyrhizobium sp. UFLA03-84]